MISYHTPLLGPLKSMAGQNTSQFLGGSILSAVFRGCGCILRLDFRCYSWNDVTVGFFIIMDWWTGSAASHTSKLLKQRGYG
jgi:hypothetical protein